jgi:uracil-DNA glycosylase family 4
MEPTGRGRKGIFIVGEAPSKAQDEGEAEGKATRLLRAKLREHGIDLDRDCWKTNAIHCHPPKSRAPSSKEVEACRPRVWKAIDELKPRLILLLGGHAVESFVGDRWTKDKLDRIGRWRGWTIPDRKANAWACPLFHPSYLLRVRNGEDRALGAEAVFDADLERALGTLGSAVPANPIREEELVKVVRDGAELNHWLSWLSRHYEEHPRDLLTIDLETTGLKPQREGHRIVSCALSWGPDECVAFPWPEDRSALRRITRLLGNEGIGKVAANLPFEDRWLTHFGLPVRGWRWDTLLAAHVQDNRERVTGLKFQAYVQFGVIGYDDDAGPWIRATAAEEKEHGANAFNRMLEFLVREPEKLLRYNGMDALLEHRLALRQMGGLT